MIPKTSMYIDTSASAEQSRADIHKMLAKFGILERRWTEAGPENTFLEFIIKRDGIPNIKIKINVPFVETSRRPGNRGSVIKTYDEKRAYRFLFHYIKALLSARDVEFGTIEEVFMQHIVMPLPDGGEATMGEVLQQQLKSGNVPSLRGFNIVSTPQALPEPEPESIYPPKECGELFNYDDPDEPPVICNMSAGHDGEHHHITKLIKLEKK